MKIKKKAVTCKICGSQLHLVNDYVEERARLIYDDGTLGRMKRLSSRGEDDNCKVMCLNCDDVVDRETRELIMKLGIYNEGLGE